MKSKTAIQWLIENLISEPYSENDFKHNLDIWNKAKKMEEQQIINAHGDKQKLKSNPGSLVTYGYWYKGEDYYNDNFKILEDDRN